MKIVLMGVSGSGKSAVGRALARQLNWPLIEGDDLHPPANMDKMRRGVPLDDEDRRPWLETLVNRMRSQDQVIVACSALKQSYRDTLRAAGDDVRFVFLRVHRQMLAGRLARRRSHFFSPTLLDSQLATLQPPQTQEADAITIDADASVAALAKRVIQQLQLG
ncbi:MAG: gluconokinase [Phycisphaeraceae bacterium]|nr:gluconokinase [Phycisphaeraceae bacterium]